MQDSPLRKEEGRTSRYLESGVPRRVVAHKGNQTIVTGHLLLLGPAISCRPRAILLLLKH